MSEPNRLAREVSPYLLQHAHNPVDWHPWGDDAFALARERNVPIFLSVGYSTCYWCHVMERESFEDDTTAALMNERFVCVKVDREERPDVDELYMAATQIMTGHGGWPMSCFLTPDTLEPFFCGTYFPKAPRSGMPTFERVLTGMSDAWRDQRADVESQAKSLAGAVREHLGRAGEPVALGPHHVERAVQTLLTMHDDAEGGFGGAPKFPQPVFLEFLLDARETVDAGSRNAIDAAVRTTLDAMMIGGIHDHVGGGFHRYAVDAFWTVPHFEKMLYDNAQLMAVYARAARVYDDEQYRRTAERTGAYVLREMSAGDPPGSEGLFSAQDAEVDGREGLNYLWTPATLNGALDEDGAAFAARVFGVDAGPNFKDPHHPGEPARSVLRLEGRPERVAARLGLEPDAFDAKLQACCERLLSVRDQREQPHLDDKILAGWNGLMIGALAQGADEFAAAATNAARYVLGSMRSPADDLLRTARAGVAKTPAFLEDHAFVALGLLALHERTGDAAHLDAARELVERAIDAFGDGAGGFYDTRDGQADLFVRSRTTHDGAVPSAVGVMLHVMLDLAERTGERVWLERAGACLASVSAKIDENPVGAINATRGLLRLLAMGERAAGLFAVADAPPDAPSSAGPVAVLSDTEVVSVSAGAPAELTLAITIEDGHHIVAAEPGDAGAGLIPLRVGLVSGQGVAVYADYPAGTPFGVEGVGTINVHTGQIDIRVALERAEGVGASPGDPVLGVSFQACSDTACLAPAAVRLAIDITLDAPTPES